MGFPGVGKQSSRGCAGQTEHRTGRGRTADTTPSTVAGGRLRATAAGKEKPTRGRPSCTPTTLNIQVGRRAHSSSLACLLARQGEGRRAAASIQGGKLPQPGFSWASVEVKVSRRRNSKGMGCAGGGVTQVVGWPLFWALRSQGEAPT